MTYFWETVDTIAPGLGWPHFGPFHLAVLAVFLLLGAVLCRGYCGMDTDKRRRWRRTVALLVILERNSLLLNIRIRLRLDGRRLAVWSHILHLIPFDLTMHVPAASFQLLIVSLYRL